MDRTCITKRTTSPRAAAVGGQAGPSLLEKERAVYAEGKQAGRENKSLRTNPYKFKSEEFWTWRSGWFDAVFKLGADRYADL